MDSEILAEADDSNITEWTVGITADMLRKQGLGQLAAQLKRWSNITQKRPVIVLDIKFPMTYPDDVPFVRIVRPRFAYRTGHVTIGGSICTEMLTPAGWRAMTVDALILSICEILRDGEAAVQFAGAGSEDIADGKRLLGARLAVLASRGASRSPPRSMPCQRWHLGRVDRRHRRCGWRRWTRRWTCHNRRCQRALRARAHGAEEFRIVWRNFALPGEVGHAVEEFLDVTGLHSDRDANSL